jgi:hypothetical protein
LTSSARRGTRIVGSLRSADGKGVVRMADRFDTDVDDLSVHELQPGYEELAADVSQAPARPGERNKD